MLIGALFLYAVILYGMCLVAYRSSYDGGCVSGLILLILIVTELFLIGRVIVNPVNRSTAVAMLVLNSAAILFVIILLIINRE